MSIEWTSHPAKRRPEQVMLAACVMFATAYAVLVSLRSPLLAGLAIAFLGVAIAPFLFPTHYRLDGERLVERRLFVTRSRPWSELRRLELGAAGALVSPYARPRWLDRYRAITVMFPPGPDRERVIEALRARVGG